MVNTDTNVEDPRRQLENKRFGRLLVKKCLTDKSKNKGYSRLEWECVCNCGKTVTVLGVNLVNGSTTSCGCYAKECHRINLLGKRIGKLVVTKYLGIDNSQTLWECTCDCGNKINLHGSYIKKGYKKNCGCDKTKYKLKKDLTGIKFDDWVVTSRADNRTTPNGQSRPCWNCVNSKGETKTVFATYIVEKIKKDLKKESKRENYAGRKFGKLTVLFEIDWSKKPVIEIINTDGTKKVYTKKKRSRYWWCECECGNRVIVNTQDLKKYKSCGCYKYSRGNYIGRKFGKLTVLSYAGRNENGVKTWNCLCECGKQKVITQNSLKSGTKSCGCNKKRPHASKSRRCDK